MELRTALSEPRLTKYENWVEGDRGRAMKLYTLNVAISEALYTPLHILEIALRNAIHDRLTNIHGQAWFSNEAVISDPYQQQKIREVIQKFGGPTSDGKIVAELTFGFWTALFGRRYAYLWGRDLHPIFDAGRPLQRREIARRLNDIRHLRNRIAHHETVIQFDLQETYEQICEITGWLSPAALAWCHQHCRFPTIHPDIPIILGNLVNPELDL